MDFNEINSSKDDILETPFTLLKDESPRNKRNEERHRLTSETLITEEPLSEIKNLAPGKTLQPYPDKEVDQPYIKSMVTNSSVESHEINSSVDYSLETPLISFKYDSSGNKQNEEYCLTSEIFIKEEPLSETEDMEETVEEMFEKMNEESQDDEHVTLIENSHPTSDFEEECLEDWTSYACQDCGEIGCDGHGDISLKLFECGPCGKQFKNGRQFNAHNLSRHFEYRKSNQISKKEAICKVCNKVLSFKTSLNEHMLSHANDAKHHHVCMLCEKTFVHKASLVTHIETHTIHPNERCGKTFGDSYDLDKHMRRHLLLIREYTCRVCGQRFRSKQACWAHHNSHIPAKSRTNLSCQVCGRTLSTKATLKEHMFIHSGEKPFECQLCGKKIRHRANFISHVQGHSLGQPHLCNFCGMGFTKKNELFSHTAAEHPEDSPFLCTICGMRFRTEPRFLKHAVSHDAYLED